MKRKQLDMTKHKILKDKNIKCEAKEIFAYLYARSFNKIVDHINIGEIQNIIHITNVGFKKNLEILEKNKYLVYKYLTNGLYEYHIY